MELSLQQLQELKTVETELLRQFIQVCQRLNLRYYLLGGTLLGAVRHQGFIPWDDDIDVGMPRADYEILMAQGQALLPEGLFLQNHVTDPDYPHNFGKLRHSGTTFVEYSLKNCRINHGVYIDIFPLDPYPEKNVRLFRLKNILLRLRITYAFSSDILRPVTRLARLLTLPLFPSLRGAVAKRDALLRANTTGSRIANHCGAWGAKEIVPAHWYGEGTHVTFEGMTVRAPREYVSWLTQVYGDYMQLPPEDKRIPHHFVADFDLTRSFRDAGRS